MKKTLAVAAVLVATLAPGSAAHASAPQWEKHGTGNGRALGNCQNSSAGGSLDAKNDGWQVGGGNGGFGKLAGGDCIPKPDDVIVDDNG